MTLEDYSGPMEVIVFNGTYKRFASLLEKDSMVVCQGKITFKSGFGNTEETKFILDKIARLDIDPNAGTHVTRLVKSDFGIQLRLPDSVKMNHLLEIKKILQDYKGSDNLSLLIVDKTTRKYHPVRIPFTVNFTEELHKKIDSIF
jgi:DNA polymerase III alpha subunit